MRPHRHFTVGHPKTRFEIEKKLRQAKRRKERSGKKAESASDADEDDKEEPVSLTEQRRKNLDMKKGGNKFAELRAKREERERKRANEEAKVPSTKTSTSAHKCFSEVLHCAV